MILSATMMLRHMGLHAHASTIESAVHKVIKEGKVRALSCKKKGRLGLNGERMGCCALRCLTPVPGDRPTSQVRTCDMSGGQASTTDFTLAVIAEIL